MRGQYTPVEPLGERKVAGQDRRRPSYALAPGFGISAGLTNLSIRHGQPGPGQPRVVVGAADVVFENVLCQPSGFAGYLAVAPGCSVMTHTSFGCEGTVDLAPRATWPWETPATERFQETANLHHLSLNRGGRLRGQEWRASWFSDGPSPVRSSAGGAKSCRCGDRQAGR
jgi:hypothetical protein